MSSSEIDTRTKILQATSQLMEQRAGKNVRMSDIAKAAGISRQAVYLHFDSRTKLMIATTKYVDEVKGLNERLKAFEQEDSGVELLEIIVDVWGNYIPEIYGIAKALLNTADTDEATAAAWNGCMDGLQQACRKVIEALHEEGMLASHWSVQEATEMCWTLISIQNWEHLTIQCNWSQSQYIEKTKLLLKQTFIEKSRMQH